MAKKETIQEFTAYDRVELLVHPFFVLEHAKRFGRAGHVKNFSEKQAAEEYKTLGFIKAWNERIKKAKADPYTIFIIVGPRELEDNRESEFFSEGLTKGKLGAMSKTYQDFLHEAKGVLGNKLLYVSQNLNPGEMKTNYLARQLHTRGYMPAHHVQINAYGEYYGDCVEDLTDNLRKNLKLIQEAYYGEQKTSVKRRKLLQHPNRKAMLSLDQRTMYFAEAAREYTKKGVITEAFVRRKKRFQRGIDAKKEAAMLNRTYRKITQKPVTKRKRAGKR